jgi:GrpB-like predicted nucleotidyltransferase (UPF0157 family)
MAVEHIGSTAVPRLAAKPIIDLMVGVENISETHELVGLGYEDMGGEPGRRYLRRRDRISSNVQIVEYGGAFWQANLAVRSYLRSHPREARRYAAVKVAAARAAPTLLAYSKEKETFMAELAERALVWFERRS